MGRLDAMGSDDTRFAGSVYPFMTVYDHSDDQGPVTVAQSRTQAGNPSRKLYCLLITVPRVTEPDSR